MLYPIFSHGKGIMHINQKSDGKSASGSGKGSIAVGKKLSKIGGVNSDLITLAFGKLKLSTAWYTNSKGTFIDLVAEPTTLGTINVQLSNTKVGPANMVVGTTYSSKGTIAGSFSGTFKGRAYTATITGTDSLSAELVGHVTAHVPAGTFDTIQANVTATINGKLSIKIGGQTVAGTITASHGETFYAAPAVGIVKFSDVDSATINVPGALKTSTKLSAKGSLVSDVLT
jgi:hypothetical protein